MKNSFTLLSVCFLFLLLGLSSCKKDYLCICFYESGSLNDPYNFVIQATSESKASDACSIAINEPYYPKPNECVMQGEIE